ncbi:glycosyltransferase [Glaciibacter flavus]|uniref:glycosyltransferase n=1 Tax=Orlajensenia flava TaxID=2565934 RepID=UPI003B00DAF3
MNGQRYLAEILDSIAEQDFDGDVETLVIDSGSTDDTLAIAADRVRVHVHRIPPAEFGHGRTRAFAARLARAPIVAYLTHDATPASNAWLRELTAPLLDGRAEAVVGRQIPRPHAFPLLKYDIRRAFAAQGRGSDVVVRDGTDLSDIALDDAAFYSDVNAAAFRSILVDVVPYRDVAYSEDFVFARDLLRAGFRKAYAPAAAVVHSNDATVREYRQRMIEETEGLRRAGFTTPQPGFLGALAHAAVGALRDERSILLDPDYDARETLGWLVINPAYHVARWLGIERGSRVAVSRLDEETPPDDR